MPAVPVNIDLLQMPASHPWLSSTLSTSPCKTRKHLNNFFHPYFTEFTPLYAFIYTQRRKAHGNVDALIILYSGWLPIYPIRASDTWWCMPPRWNLPRYQPYPIVGLNFSSHMNYGPLGNGVKRLIGWLRCKTSGTCMGIESFVCLWKRWPWMGYICYCVFEFWQMHVFGEKKQ